MDLGKFTPPTLNPLLFLREILKSLLTVSVPLRGLGFERIVTAIGFNPLSSVSVPLQGLGFERFRLVQFRSIWLHGCKFQSPCGD